MLGLPKSTEMNKQLPKKAIYAKFQMNTAVKDKIDCCLKIIRWKNYRNYIEREKHIQRKQVADSR